MPIGVLIHGCHLQATGWEDIVWGDPEKGILGRIPKALQVAHDRRADLIYWGTGASEKDGLTEAAYTFNYAVQRAGSLPPFKGLDVYQVQSLLQKTAFIDLETQNTKQEIKRCLGVCHARDISTLILVSSPTHIGRCITEAEVLRAAGYAKGINIEATASDTCYANSAPSDVLILEPPHRGDRPDVPFYKTLRRVNRFRKEHGTAEKLNKELNALFDRFEPLV